MVFRIGHEATHENRETNEPFLLTKESLQAQHKRGEPWLNLAISQIKKVNLTVHQGYIG